MKFTEPSEITNVYEFCPCGHESRKTGKFSSMFVEKKLGSLKHY